MQLTERQRSILVRLADQAIPRDDFPSAVDVGDVDFVERVLAEDRPDWRPRVERALELTGDLDTVLADSDGAWLIRLLAQGFYASPQSWTMVGWRPDAAGSWTPLETPLALTPRTALADRYDCVVIGSGAGGGTAAQVLAESGRSVLVVETGGYPSLAADHLRNPRSVAGLPAPTDPDPLGRPRVSVVDGESRVVMPPDGAWGNNAFTVGGGTRVYGAQTPTAVSGTTPTSTSPTPPYT